MVSFIVLGNVCEVTPPPRPVPLQRLHPRLLGEGTLAQQRDRPQRTCQRAISVCPSGVCPGWRGAGQRLCPFTPSPPAKRGRPHLDSAVPAMGRVGSTASLPPSRAPGRVGPAGGR